VYTDAAAKLGCLLAEKDLTCVCGAGRDGLMRTVADACLQNDGKVIGVIPRFMYDEGWWNPYLTNLFITNNIHERKKKMADLSDAVIALPGGCGTMEELLEIITWKQLGLYDGTIVILNVNNYYDPLIQMLKNAVDEQFMREDQQTAWAVAATPEEAMGLSFISTS
jgi:uncharacterized protein (TIGR00730 family)